MIERIHSGWCRSVLAEDRPVRHLLGDDPKMLRLERDLRSVAPTGATVLICGESGTGKSLLARQLHESSGRDGPLVTFCCGAVPESLMAAELFGHVRGAFTGAVTAKTGKIASAEAGTLFIDEINTAAPELQVRLLRLLQEKIYEPVGSDRPQKADVRFVLASNEPLNRQVAEGRFRADLYYRIDVIRLEVPPLRHRRSDIPLLARFFLSRYAERMNRPFTGFHFEAIRRLCAAPWPGNVRQLENAVQHAVALSTPPLVGPEDLPSHLETEGVQIHPEAGAPADGGWVAPVWRPQPLREALQVPERLILTAALEANGWNRQQTARQLGIDRTTLYKKIKRYGLTAP
ncbi:MAG: sigma-54 dependent transcriptional regulator [Phycisphaeraceae bacterium]|nr:sigma-54 dependent transcriptional regulator [Phycisphaeraceae bacterium]